MERFLKVKILHKLVTFLVREVLLKLYKFLTEDSLVLQRGLVPQRVSFIGDRLITRDRFFTGDGLLTGGSLLKRRDSHRMSSKTQMVPQRRP